MSVYPACLCFTVCPVLCRFGGGARCRRFCLPRCEVVLCPVFTLCCATSARSSRRPSRCTSPLPLHFLSVYPNPEALEADYVAEKLHPKDLKGALTTIINECVPCTPSMNLS